jgi:hypothetical protein
MLAWLVAIGAAGLWQWHRGRLPAWLVACVALLATASVLLPASLGALWPAGPRLFPYALILLVSGLSWPRRYARGVGLAALVVVLGMNLANGLKARALDREFRSFLSAVDLVDPGSKLLPILVDPYAGSKSIWPFWSLPSAYNVYRGGASPYVFATPYVKTGASPLQYRHRDEFGYAFLYEPGQPASAYRGVAGAYDYVLVWGVDPDLDAVLGRELALVHRDGAFRLYAAPAPERAERKRREAP